MKLSGKVNAKETGCHKNGVRHTVYLAHTSAETFYGVTWLRNMTSSSSFLDCCDGFRRNNCSSAL